MALVKPVRRSTGLSMGIIIMLMITIFFMGRFVQVALSRNVMGNHAYIQMINAGIPMLKAGYYNEDAYIESDITIGSLVLETLYIDKINVETLLSFQIPGFREFASNNELVKSDDFKESFKLTDSSVEKKPSNVEDKPSEPSKGNKGEVRNPEIVKSLDNSKPEVLIYSSHTAEGFGEGGSFSNDQSKNIIGVGALVEKELEEYYGISVIHDKTMYAADYNSAYQRSREGVKTYLNKYDDLKVIVDLHRDGGPKRENVTTNINGEDVARIMFSNGRNNPYYGQSSKMVDNMINDLNKNFPGLSRGVLTYNKAKSNSFNQDLAPEACLIEVGSENNTVEEAMNSAKYIARIIAEEVNRKNN